MITATIAIMISRGIPTLTGWGLRGWGWIPTEWGGVFNHLWQSTVFAAVAALLAMALRKNHARARYWLWLAASCKFLIPFSLLVGLGLSIGASIGSGVENVIEKLWPSAPAIVAQPEMTIMFDEISQPFTQVSIPAVAPEHRSVMPEVLFGLWACGCAIVLIRWFRRWRRVRAAVRSARPVHFEVAVPHPLPDGRGFVIERRGSAMFPHPDGWGWNSGRVERARALTGAPQVIRIMASPALIEPGIFGIFRPVLLLPEGIADRLTPAQLKSILAHELCHVKRRDNLAAAMHMMVEAAFWFHPLVWWIGARLVEERERACDEEVLRSGSEPGVYAESILQVCKFYLESPLKCVAGVTGSDLKKRIESIMGGLPGRNLTPARKLMLIAASIGAIAGPVIFGVLAAPHIRAQSQPRQNKERLAFEVASVKPNKTADNRGMKIESLPGGGFSARGVPLYLLIVFAYDLPIQTPRISGGPEWLRSDRFDIEAKAPSDAIPKGATAKTREAMTRLMLQTLLAERFKLVIRIDKKELPVYAAVVGKNGPKLQKSKIEEKDCPDNGTTVAGTTCHTFFGGMGRGLHGDAVDMSDLVQFVANWADRPVIDKTGIQGLYNIQTDGWTRMVPSQPSPDGTVSDEAQALADPARPTLQMVFDRLGLKLESQKAPVDMYVIVRAEKPSDNFEPPIGAAQAPAAQVSAQPARALDGPRPSFEVASIRPSKSETGDRELSGKPGRRLSASNATLKMLVMLAYQVTANELSGGPDWLASDGFDIEAKPENPNATPEQFRQMVQRMLEERFQLKSHFETKEVPIYTLVVGKRAKLQESKGNEPEVAMRSNYGVVTGVRATMPMFATALSKRLGRQVVDETGLKGAYNFKLEFTPEPGQKGSDPDEHRAPPPGDHPSIFTALQEQLGLNLKAGKGPVQVLVIDHAEKPTDNSTAPVVKPDAAAAPQASGKPTYALLGALAKLARPAAALAIQAQPQEKTTLAFEVASIKRSKPGGTRTGVGTDPGRLTITNATLKYCIEWAYGIKDYQISGPGWLESDRFDIVAKAERVALEDRLRLMMQTLLADRFKLTLHRETKELPVYALTVAKEGAKIHEVKPGSRGNTRGGRGHLSGEKISMPEFADLLTRGTAREIDRPVIDRTGLKGVFDITLDWTPENPQPLGGDPAGRGAIESALGPDIFRALQQQLGLRLESQKGPAEIFVIDRVEKPTDNFEPPGAKQENALHSVAPLVAPQGSARALTGAPQREKPPAFEVASIKPNKIGNSGGEGSRRENISTSPGTLSMSNVTLKSCIKWAYSIQDPQLSAGPDWLAGDRFDVIAKTAEPAPESQLRLMLQALLADRFKLTLHRESKTLAGYALVAGKNGPKLQPSEGEGAPQFRGGNARVEVSGYSMQDLAEFLANPLQTYVANMTGLKGRFDFSIDVLPFLSPDAPVLKEDMAAAFERALEQQVGLKLEGRKFPVEVLVIDHAEKPTEN